MYEDTAIDKDKDDVEVIEGVDEGEAFAIFGDGDAYDLFMET